MPAYFLQCVSDNVAYSRNLFCLPNSVDAVKSLIFDHRVPLWLHKEYVICSRQIQPSTVSAELELRS